MAFTLDRYGHRYDDVGQTLAARLDALAAASLTATQRDKMIGDLFRFVRLDDPKVGTSLARSQSKDRQNRPDGPLTWAFVVGDTGLEPVTSETPDQAICALTRHFPSLAVDTDGPR